MKFLRHDLFESIGLVGNGFVQKKKLLMELQTWVDFMEL